MYSLKQIAEITGSEFIGRANYAVKNFLSDSRSFIDADTLFVALKTSKNNGHNYIPDLIARGVTCFLVEKGEINFDKYKEASFIVSENPLKALQTLAEYHRKQFSIPVIGIAGSNGKTIVKEWLYQLLKDKYIICRSPRSFNSQLGVPLSILNLNESHTLGIFEAGISQPGEMNNLASIIAPTIGLFTSIGGAHEEGFRNREEKIREKFRLLTGCETVIVNGLNSAAIQSEVKGKIISISTGNDTDAQLAFKNDILHIEFRSEKINFQVPFKDEASIQNCATCIILLKELGFANDDIQKRILTLQPLALRLEIKNAIHNSLVINDYYNSDLDSLKIALNFLQQQNRRQYKVVVISDIEQSGVPDNLLYKEISGLIISNKVDFFIGIGKRISNYKLLFKSGALFFDNTESFIRNFKTIDHRFSHSTVLLKGARSFGFEQIGNLLQQKSHDTVLEVNLNSLTENVNYYKALLKPGVKLMCMVKAMGYGGGGSELAKTLQHIGVNYLAVAYADEGVELRQSQISLPIMVMSPEVDALEDIINYNLEPEIYSFKTLSEFIHKLDHLGISEPYPVHIKIDTGMRRLGFEEAGIEKLISELRKSPQVKVQSVFSHLVATDNTELDEFTNKQIKIFENACSVIERELNYSFLKHICNSGGITRFPNAHYDMVRLGIGMHGIGINEEEQKKLQNVASLKTRISQIKHVKAGETVGYNRNGVAEKDIRIATIPIGYADGFHRSLGNGKFGVFIKGKLCKTIGNICMDMCMVDVTDSECNEGDAVIVFDSFNQIKQMAFVMNTITYEVLTSVSARVKRVYVQE